MPLLTIKHTASLDNSICSQATLAVCFLHNTSSVATLVLIGFAYSSGEALTCGTVAMHAHSVGLHSQALCKQLQTYAYQHGTSTV